MMSTSIKPVFNALGTPESCGTKSRSAQREVNAAVQLSNYGRENPQIPVRRCLTVISEIELLRQTYFRRVQGLQYQACKFYCSFDFQKHSDVRHGTFVTLFQSWLFSLVLSAATLLYCTEPVTAVAPHLRCQHDNSYCTVRRTGQINPRQDCTWQFSFSKQFGFSFLPEN